MLVSGMALAPWEVLAGGKIRTDAEEEVRRISGEKGRTISNSNWERTEDQRKVCLALEKVAAEVGARSIQAGLPYDLLRTRSAADQDPLCVQSLSPIC